MEKSFGIIGGDGRQQQLAALLRRDGAAVHTYRAGSIETEDDSLTEALKADTVILPLPLSRGDGLLNCPADPVPLDALFARLRGHRRILAGQVRPEEQEKAAGYGLVLEDYFLCEELTVANAAATAEGAIRTAMEHTDRTLLGRRALVVGFGRIGKLLSFRLHGLGVTVAVSARKAADLAWIRAYGYEALSTNGLSGHLQGFDLVFNTVPAPVLDGRLLSQLPPQCLCIDLASRRGIDAAAAQDLGLRCVWARGLPGRLTPQTAAEAIREAVYHILSQERGVIS